MAGLALTIQLNPLPPEVPIDTIVRDNLFIAHNDLLSVWSQATPTPQTLCTINFWLKESNAFEFFIFQQMPDSG